MDRAQGRVDLDRERIEAGVDQIGSPPRLTKAMNDAIEAYFGKAAPWLEKEMAAGRNDGKYTINSDQLAGMIVPAVQAFFAVRDAALTEAEERAGAARDGALAMLALAGLAVTALLGVLAGVTVMLRRRVITPLATLTGAVGDLAAGRHDATIPTSAVVPTKSAPWPARSRCSRTPCRQEGRRRGGSGRSRCQDRARPARRPYHRRFRSDDRRHRRDRVVGLDRAGSLRRHADPTAERPQNSPPRSRRPPRRPPPTCSRSPPRPKRWPPRSTKSAVRCRSSARIAGEAVKQAQKTDARVGELAKAAAADRRRGEADQRHRRADQPAGAQRHHRGGAGRRGRAGFAVVAPK